MPSTPGTPGGHRSTVVVASDAFKGSLTSTQVGDAVRAGVLDVAPWARVAVVPVADGGEGTVAAALAAGWAPVAVEVHGPTGAPVSATLATTSPDRTGVGAVLVEMADACGIGRLPGGVRAPTTASSRGLGEAIRAALALGPAELVVAVGGSASTDGGAGLLAALGARLLDDDGRDLPDGGAALVRLDRVDLAGLDPRLSATRIVLAADVDSPLLGPDGAAAVFAPQKGAGPRDVEVLETALARWSTVVSATLGSGSAAWPTLARMPGAGAAGGVGFALLAVLGAELRPGVDVVLDLVGLDRELATADLVVTGEGALDRQTLAGKAVAGVARRAVAAGVPVVAVCGRLDLDAAELSALGVHAAYALGALEPDPSRAVRHAAGLVRRAARGVAAEWLSAPPG